VLADLERHPRASDEDVAAWVKRLTIEKRANRQRMIDGDASSSDLRSIDEVMKELAVAPPEASSPSAMAVGKPPDRSRRSKLPFVLLGGGAIVALIALVLRMDKSKPEEPDAVVITPPAAASSPAIVVSSLIVESAAPPPPDPPQASVAPPAKPPVRKPPPKVDPASFQ
jgi:hypothetical protein